MRKIEKLVQKIISFLWIKASQKAEPKPNLDEIYSLCRRHYHKGLALPINCHDCRYEAEEDYRSEQDYDDDDGE